METKWRVKTESGEIVATAGDGLALVGGELRTATDEPIAGATAFLRADRQCLRVAGVRSDLIVDGRAALGGIAMLGSEGSHTVRVGRTTLSIRRLTFEMRRLTGADSGRCAISGEPLGSPDLAVFCSCGTVALERFLRELGHDCPRCGARYPEGMAL